MKINVRKLLLWSGALLIILAISGYLLMDYAVDRFLKSIAIHAELPADQLQVSAAGASQADERPKPSEAKPEDGASSDPEGSRTSPPASRPPGSPEPSLVPDASHGQTKTPADSPGPSGTGQPKGLPASQTEQPHATFKPDISQDKAEAVEEKITIKEKTAVLSTLLKKLNASDIDTLKKLAGGGLSNEEKGEAKKIIMKKLTAEEYNRLIDIAAKYGLSQGKHQ
ncbi:hypothetical protein [Paenibacillus contaminans]|nr:hypothetical protein [Paenibacillus contaminans]